MTPFQFVQKWRRSTTSERAAAQSHFIDLCAVLNHQTPAEADPDGEWFAFEYGVQRKRKGGASGQGWADVWKKNFFGWEYKGKHKDLDAAYDQLLQYRESLQNPPILVVCDIERIIARTNFTNTPTRTIEIKLDDLLVPGKFDDLRRIFFDPESLRPGETVEIITQRAAQRLATVADTMKQRGVEPVSIARYLDRLVFCLFAEDVGLLPRGLFTRLVEENRFNPARVSRLIATLFETMATGGDFGPEAIRHFNGNLFQSAPHIELTQEEVDSIRTASLLDWKDVDASIFGTLFERVLDERKRTQLGAHYTSRSDIESLVNPVVLAPLRARWDEVRTHATTLLERDAEAAYAIQGFLDELGHLRILDPACGSGNFLYVSLQLLLDLEKSVVTWAHEHSLTVTRRVRPEQFYGLELNVYAHDLAQTTLWIGWLQWLRTNGEPFPEEPILRSTNNIRNQDAILDTSDGTPRDAVWPDAEYIVGNPPFLGDKVMRRELEDGYVDALRKLYAGRVPGGADLCCYWFEKARAQIEARRAQRAGLIGTQGIRGGANREVLKHIKESGDIFFAVSDRPWVNEGANVHISMVGFDNGSQTGRTLDGQIVASVNANLSANADVTLAKTLLDNANLCFLGVMKAGDFNMPEATALKMLQEPNVHGRPNSDVLRPRLTAEALLRNVGKDWIVDFGVSTTESEATLYEAPYAYLEKFVKPVRLADVRKSFGDNWWLQGRPRPRMRASISLLKRVLVTPEVSKHRVFAWIDVAVLPDHKLRAFSFEEDYFFGVLHSHAHEVWALRLGSQLRERESGFTYTPTTCFETFPFPRPTEDQTAAIAAAAKQLDELRGNWLLPREWTREEILEFPASVDGPWSRYVTDADERGIGTARYPRTVAKDVVLAKNLVKRTLTNLYNERPKWLDNAHAALDAAVFAAYGWPLDLSDDEILARLLALNLESK